MKTEEQHGCKANVLVFAGFFHPHVGGSENVMREVLAYLLMNGHGVRLVTPNTNKALFHETIDGIEVWRLPCLNALSGTYPIPLPTPRTIRTLARLCRQREDVVYTYGRFYVSALIGYAVSRLKRVPMLHSEFVSSHSVTSSPLVNLIARLYDHTAGAMVVRKASALTANCRATSRFLEHLGGRRIAIISPPSGINLAVFKKVDTKLRDKMGLTGSVVITSVSRLIWAKGIQDLIAAFPLIVKRRPDAELLVVGDGPYKSELMRLASKAGPGRIHFLGERSHEEIAEILSASDVLVNPSHAEGLIAIPVIEAGAIGVPSVTTDAGGTCEIIEDGKTGLVVQPGDVSAIAAKTLDLIENSEIRTRIGTNIRALVRETFDSKVILPQYLREIESLASVRIRGGQT